MAVVNVTTNEQFLTAQASEVSRANGRVRYNLQLGLSDQAPAGPFQSEIVVHTNDRKLTRVPLRVVANIMPGVTASQQRCRSETFFPATPSSN